jgi:hypothetical protein
MQLEKQTTEAAQADAQVRAEAAAMAEELQSRLRDCFYEVAPDEPSDELSEAEFARLVMNRSVTRDAPRVYIEGCEEWQTLGELADAVEMHTSLSAGVVHILTVTLPEAEATEAEAEVSFARAAVEATAMAQEMATLLAQAAEETADLKNQGEQEISSLNDQAVEALSRLKDETADEMAYLKERADAAEAETQRLTDLLEKYKRVGAAALFGSKEAKAKEVQEGMPPPRGRSGTHGLSSEASRNAGGGFSRVIGFGVDSHTPSPELLTVSGRLARRAVSAEEWGVIAQRHVREEAQRNTAQPGRRSPPPLTRRQLDTHAEEQPPQQQPQPQPQPEPELEPPPSAFAVLKKHQHQQQSEAHAIRITSEFARQSSAMVQHPSWFSSSGPTDRDLVAASTSSTRIIEQMKRDRERRTQQAERRRRR